jgi:protein N-terminal methyltransferase
VVFLFFNLKKDCGAGIGRVSKNFLLNHFEKVDLVEQEKNFLDSAREKMFTGEYAKRVDRYIACGLQDFTPEPERYGK